MTTDHLLEGLNDAQRKAVQHEPGPLLIIAGPGSGKTRVIVHRVAYLIKGYGADPRSICVLTFTNKAGRELRDRLNQLLGAPVARQVTAGTFHALCAGLLRESGEAVGLDPNFTIYDRDDQLSLLKRAMTAVNIDPRQFTPNAILHGISGAKAQLQDPAAFALQAGSYLEEVTLRAYEQYQRMLRDYQAVDFDDLLCLTHRLFAQHPSVLERHQQRFRHIMVDEFQDTNVAQYAIARQLTGASGNITVVGDPDQSIYSWRHADIRNILSFRHDYRDAEVLLEENYRSSARILSAAENVISKSRQRIKRRLVPTIGDGPQIVVHEVYDEEEEAEWTLSEVDRLRRKGELTYGDAAIMYRVNAQSRALEEACLRHGVPYRLVGATRFYQRREIRDVLAYLRVLHNPADDVSLERIINVPTRGIGQRTADELARWARTLGIPLRRALGILAEDPEVDTPIPRAGQAALAKLGALLNELQEAVGRLEVAELLDLTLQRTGYRDYLIADDGTGEERWDNVRELRTVAADQSGGQSSDSLGDFLALVSLVSDADNAEATDSVTLITLHQAKGLEFKAVFMVGMEDGLLPHSRSRDDPEQMEEERRLCYVGMTRAKERLYLLHAFRRRFMGNSQVALPSRFLQDIPDDLISSPENDRARPRGMRAGPHSWVRPNTRVTVGIDGVGDADDAAPGPPPFDPGDRVNHPKFGSGIIVNCREAKGDFELTVAFDESGVKRLLHSLAKLTPKG